jgi:hypothetical protein
MVVPIFYNIYYIYYNRRHELKTVDEEQILRKPYKNPILKACC